MARLTRFSIAKKDIVDFFDERGTDLFTETELHHILRDQRVFWRLAQSLNTAGFIELMLTYTPLRKMEYDYFSKPLIKYIWRNPNPLDIALGLRENSFISHYTAMFYNDLINQIPKTIYTSVELSNKVKITDSKPPVINQESIDNAFSKPQRISSNMIPIDDVQIHLLNSKYTNKLGVLDNSKGYAMTDLERTIIDITVRPEYSGGIFEVLKAYEVAASKISINKMVNNLNKIGYIYPYHQLIGFYMERAGCYQPARMELLERMEKKFNFYLTYDIKEMSFSEKWKVYYPKGF